MSDIKKEKQDNSQNEEYRKADYETKEYANGFIASFIKMVENFNVRFSKHGNPPIYENSTFPWVKEIEDNWEKIREEIDQVMERREELPSFHEIMPEVKTITNDNN